MAQDEKLPHTAILSPAEVHKGSGFAVENPKWYIGECKPTRERVLRTILQKDGYNVSLASQVETKVYKSRNRRQVERIVIPGKVFIHIDERHIERLLFSYPSLYRFLINRAASDVKEKKRVYASLTDREMQDLQYMLHNAPNPVTITTDDLTLGQPIRVVRGPLAGLEGDYTQVGRASCIVVKLQMGTTHYIFTEVPLEDIQPL